MFFLFPTRNIIFNQVIFSLLLVAIAIMSKELLSGLSVGVGSSVAILPCLIFQKVFFATKNKDAAQIVKGFYLALGLKLLALIVLFIVVMQWQSLDIKLFFMAFLAGQIFYWGNHLFLLYKGTVR